MPAWIIQYSETADVQTPTGPMRTRLFRPVAGGRYPGILLPREGRALVYGAMTDAGLRFTWHELNGQHAFMRDEGPRYDPELALTCYGLTLELFKRTLGEGDLPAS